MSFSVLRFPGRKLASRVRKLGEASDLVHGFVTRDGTPPAEFRRIAREQAAAMLIHALTVELVEAGQL